MLSGASRLHARSIARSGIQRREVLVDQNAPADSSQIGSLMLFRATEFLFLFRTPIQQAFPVMSRWPPKRKFQSAGRQRCFSPSLCCSRRRCIYR